MELILGNIAEMDTDAIVIPAHPDLLPMPGIRQAVFEAADGERLLHACKNHGKCRIGQTVITPAFGLPSKYLIHVIGPGWYSGRKTERTLYATCYFKALYRAYGFHCKTVALPLMFSGENHIPRAQALQIIFQVVETFEKQHRDMTIYLVLYKPSIFQLAQQLKEKKKDGC